MRADAPPLKRAIAVGRSVFGPVAILFLLLAAWNGREVAGNLLGRVNPWTLGMLALLWAALNTVTPIATALILRGLGADVSYATSLRIHVQRLPARYLPGGIWHTVSRVVDFRRLGVTSSQLATLVLVENLVPLATALALGAVMARYALGGALPFGALLVGSAALLVAVRLLPSRKPFDGPTALPATALWGSVAVFLCFWVLAAASFATYWSALTSPDGSAAGLAAAAIYLLAWAAGFVAFLAPQGIGVFEAVAGWMLRGEAPFATMAFLVAGFRLITLAGDLVAYGSLRLLQSLGKVGDGPGAGDISG